MVTNFEVLPVESGSMGSTSGSLSTVTLCTFVMAPTKPWGWPGFSGLSGLWWEGVRGFSFPTTPWVDFKDTSMYMEVYTEAVVLGFIMEYLFEATRAFDGDVEVLCTALGVSRASAWGFLPLPIHLGTSGWDPRCLMGVAVLAFGSWRCDNTFGVACLAPASGTCRPLEIACFFPLPRRCLGFHFLNSFAGPGSAWVLASPAVLRQSVLLCFQQAPGARVGVVLTLSVGPTICLVCEGSKTEVLCCNCFLALCLQAQGHFKRSCFALVERENKPLHVCAPTPLVFLCAYSCASLCNNITVYWAFRELK